MTQTHDGERHLRFLPGDRVTDRTDDGRPSMRVLYAREETADEVYIEAIGATVHEVNRDCDPQEPVYQVVFESDLDSLVPDWEDWPERAIQSRLKAFCLEWKVPVRSYAYPSSRLVAKPAESDT